jgi:Homeodomain-like domain-containing protein
MRNKAEVEMVLSLLARDYSDLEVSRATGIPRSTVRDWRAASDGRRPQA